MSKVLAEGKFIKVVEPIQKLNGINLLKVTMKCACCLHDLPTFEIMPERLCEWQEKIKNEKNFQPLCKFCVKAHKKWHPKEKQPTKTREEVENALANHQLTRKLLLDKTNLERQSKQIGWKEDYLLGYVEGVEFAYKWFLEEKKETKKEKS